jgi:hypothetical protein
MDEEAIALGICPGICPENRITNFNFVSLQGASSFHILFAVLVSFAYRANGRFF